MESNNGKRSKRDGSYQWSITARDSEILQELEAFNKTVPKITLTHNGTKTKKPSSFVVQFSWYKQAGDKTKTQTKRGVGCNWNKGELHQAKERTRVISLKLQDNSFDWLWFDEYVKGITPMDELQQKLNKPLGELISEFKASKGNIKSTSWSDAYQWNFDKLLNIPSGEGLTKKQYEQWLKQKQQAIAKIHSQPLTQEQVKQVLDSSDYSNHTKQFFCYAMAAMLKHHGIYDPFSNLLDDAAKKYPHKPNNRYIPSDSEIIYHYENSFKIKKQRGTKKKNLDNVPNWQFTYGLMATYGLRAHEVFNIENWDKPVHLKAGEWQVVDSNDNEITQNSDVYLPAFNDPNNTSHYLAISHTTKTGCRVAMPISPANDDWIERFKLKGKLRLPIIELGTRGATYSDPNKRQRAKVSQMCTKFQKAITQFQSHCLRHAFNARGRVLGYNVPALAKSMGHGEQMNSSTYVKHMGLATTLELLDNAQKQAKERTTKTKDEALEIAKELATGDDSKQALLAELIAKLYQ